PLVVARRLRDLLVARRAPRTPRPRPDPLAPQADQGHRRGPPQERSRGRGAPRPVAPWRSPAHRLDSLGRAAGGARTCSPPRPTRLAARHRPQSAARHARAAQPPAGINQDLADQARAARTAALSPRRYYESGPLILPPP